MYAQMSAIWTTSLIIWVGGLGAAFSEEPNNVSCSAAANGKVRSLEGEQSVGDESFWYESRVEETAQGIYRFSYCLKNRRQYQAMNVQWGDGNSQEYLVGTVSPQREISAYRDSTHKQFIAAPRKLKYTGAPMEENRTIEPETLVSSTDPQSNEAKTLRSGAKFEIAVNDKIASLVASGSYQKYDPSDFVTLEAQFTSSIVGNEGEMKQVENKLELKILGDIKNGESWLGSFPRFWSVPSVIEAQYLLGEGTGDPKIWASIDPLKGSYSTSHQILGPIKVQSGSLKIRDQFFGGTYAALPITYYSLGD